MECEKFSQQLELISSHEEDNILLEKAIKHLKTCPHCQENNLLQQQFDKALREKMPAITTPPFLASKIVNQISSRARPIGREWRWSYILGGVAVCLLIFVSYNQTKIISRLDRLGVTRPLAIPQNLIPSHYALLDIVATIATQRHQSILSSHFVVFDDNLTNDSFQDKFSFKIALPAFSRNLKLVGGSKCHSCYYEVAYLLYKTDSDSISLCMFSATEFGLDSWDGKPTMFKKKDYNVAVWKKGTLAYAMVSQVPENKAKSIIWDFQE